MCDGEITIERGTRPVPPNEHPYSRAWCSIHHWIVTNEQFPPDKVLLHAVAHRLDINFNWEGDNPLNPDER